MASAGRLQEAEKHLAEAAKWFVLQSCKGHSVILSSLQSQDKLFEMESRLWECC